MKKLGVPLLLILLCLGLAVQVNAANQKGDFAGLAGSYETFTDMNDGPTYGFGSMVGTFSSSDEPVPAPSGASGWSGMTGTSNSPDSSSLNELQIAQVPEPSTLILTVLCLASLVGFRMKSRPDNS
jgi:hypothetical protein